MICKIFECVIKDSVCDYLFRNELLSSAQHGFIRKHSTCTNLLESLNDCIINARNENFTSVAYVDFAKAFDSVTQN